MSEYQTSTLVLDLDQPLQRAALHEAIRFLSSIPSLPSCSPSIRSQVQLALLRLTWLAIHLRFPASELDQLRTLNRVCRELLGSRSPLEAEQIYSTSLPRIQL